MTKTPAQGPYEVVTVIDEEGKARGKNGEQWILIRNADGAIATVYPGREAEAPARLLAAAWSLRDRLREARSFVANSRELAHDTPAELETSNLLQNINGALLEAGAGE